MQIEYFPTAEKYLRKLLKSNTADAEKIVNKIELLAENPAPPGACKMRGKHKNHMRIRIGDFRAVYFVESGRIKITDIGPRPTIYRKRSRRK